LERRESIGGPVVLRGRGERLRPFHPQGGEGKAWRSHLSLKKRKRDRRGQAILPVQKGGEGRNEIPPPYVK